MRSSLLQGILSPCPRVKESLTLPTSKVSNEPDGMQGTKVQGTKEFAGVIIFVFELFTDK